MAARRRRDPEGTRAALLQAALEEFADHGRAGARTEAIAERAGVNKQLISHHFGGKDGLYEALVARWAVREAAFAAEDLPLGEVVAGYAADGARHRAMHRLFVREALDEAADPQAGPGPEAVADLRERQRRGEVASDLDPALLLLALQGAAAAGVVFGEDVRRLTGLEPGSDAFAERYGELLRRLVAHLAPAMGR